jgi:hypothetical protein
VRAIKSNVALKGLFLALALLNLWVKSVISLVVHHNNGHVSVSLSQQSFVKTLIESQNLTVTGTSTFITPHRSGLPIDAIIHQDMSSSDRDKL